ncbi:MAG: acetamidase/formamidase family protein [Candidatus Odinarchaeia archaeon]
MNKLIKKPSFESLSFIKNCTLGPLNEPIATVDPGEIVEIETFDCYGDVITPEQPLDKVIQENIPFYENPVTGPIYINGAKPGDTLAVEILDIALPKTGIITIMPCCGALQPWLEESPVLTKFVSIENNKVIFETKSGRKITLDAKPFIGTIGVAPFMEAISTFTPSRHGGNMDCPDVTVGNTLYLPVFREGALFGLGDVHALQGDGEICGYAVEIPSKVKLKFNLIKNKPINWPRIETPNEIMVVCSDKPLEDAMREAYRELIRWLETDYGFEKYEAYMFLSIAGKSKVTQIVDPLYTVTAGVEKKYLQ